MITMLSHFCCSVRIKPYYLSSTLAVGVNLNFVVALQNHIIMQITYSCQKTINNTRTERIKTRSHSNFLPYETICKLFSFYSPGNICLIHVSLDLICNRYVFQKSCVNLKQQ